MTERTTRGMGGFRGEVITPEHRRRTAAHAPSATAPSTDGLG